MNYRKGQNMKKLITSLCLAMLGVSAQAAWPTGESAATIAYKIEVTKEYVPDKTWCNTNPLTMYPYTKVAFRQVTIIWVEPTPSAPQGMLHTCIYYIYD